MAITSALRVRRPAWTWLLIPGCACLIALFAWSSDDAEISYRVVENVVAGHGPVFNRDERVMVFTHPLWLGCLAALRLLTRLHAHWCAAALGLACSLATLLSLRQLLERAGPGAHFSFAVFVALAATSFTFLAYQTSGLENSLTHLLLLLAARAFVAGDGRQTSIWVWLGLLNRLDQGLLLLPLMAAAALGQWRTEGFLRTLRLQATAALPLLCWELFSAVYYGFLLPNTAVAKLWPLTDQRLRGFDYLVDLILAEPVHAAVLGALVVAALWQVLRSSAPGDRGGRATLLLIGGAALQTLYVIWVGGDFMRGRFLTSAAVALALAGCLSLALRRPEWPAWRPLVGGVLALLCLTDLRASAESPRRHWYTGRPGAKTLRWISNEWSFYADRSSLLRAPFSRLPPIFSAVERDDPQRQMTFCLKVGDPEERYPPNVKWLMRDWAFITDPFTARIPDYNPDSNVGHVIKSVPSEYLALEKAALVPRYRDIDRPALEAAYRRQRLADWKDPSLQRLFFVVTAIVREPLFTPLRRRALLLYYSGRWRRMTAEELLPFQEAHRPYW